MDGKASLSVALYEYYSGGAAGGQENLLSKQYEYSVEMWSAFISYGIKRGEFKKTDARELIDILLLPTRECGCTAPLCLWMSRYQRGSFIM